MGVPSFPFRTVCSSDRFKVGVIHTWSWSYSARGESVPTTHGHEGSHDIPGCRPRSNSTSSRPGGCRLRREGRVPRAKQKLTSLLLVHADGPSMMSSWPPSPGTTQPNLETATSHLAEHGHSSHKGSPGSQLLQG